MGAYELLYSCLVRSEADMTVDRDELERCLDKLRGQVSDLRAGLFGPGSMAWEIEREMILLAGGGRATLLQLAHPFVAYAIEQHSVTKSGQCYNSVITGAQDID